MSNGTRRSCLMKIPQYKISWHCHFNFSSLCSLKLLFTSCFLPSFCYYNLFLPLLLWLSFLLTLSFLLFCYYFRLFLSVDILWWGASAKLPPVSQWVLLVMSNPNLTDEGGGCMGQRGARGGGADFRNYLESLLIEKPTNCNWANRTKAKVGAG
jgi:hypothetical protein